MRLAFEARNSKLGSGTGTEPELEPLVSRPPVDPTAAADTSGPEPEPEQKQEEHVQTQEEEEEEKEEEHEQEQHQQHEQEHTSSEAKRVRDPGVDSDFDPYFDLSEEEDIDPELTFKHPFKASQPKK